MLLGQSLQNMPMNMRLDPGGRESEQIYRKEVIALIYGSFDLLIGGYSPMSYVNTAGR